MDNNSNDAVVSSSNSAVASATPRVGAATVAASHHRSASCALEPRNVVVMVDDVPKKFLRFSSNGNNRGNSFGVQQQQRDLGFWNHNSNNLDLFFLVDNDDDNDDDGNSHSSGSSSSNGTRSSRGDSSVGSEDWPIEATHLCYELESNHLPCQNRRGGDVLELRSSFIRERDVPRILQALERNTSVVTADLCEYSFSKLHPTTSKLKVLASICALPGLQTLYLSHFHNITLDVVNTLVDGWTNCRRQQQQRDDSTTSISNSNNSKMGNLLLVGGDQDDMRDDYIWNNDTSQRKKRKADDSSRQLHSSSTVASNFAAYFPHGYQNHYGNHSNSYNNNNKKTSATTHSSSSCQLKALRIQDCGFYDENTANIFWEQAAATLSPTLNLLEFVHAQTPFQAYSLSTFLRCCGMQPQPKLQHLHLTSDSVNPTMLSWSVLTGGIMECRHSLRTFSLQRVDTISRPTDNTMFHHEYALGHALGRALLAGAVSHELAPGAPPPPPFSGMLSLLLPVLAMFPHLKTLRLHDWQLEPSDAHLLATTLSGSFKSLKCLDLNDCYWEDDQILHAAMTQKRLHRLHVYATEPAALHIRSLLTHLPNNGSLTRVTVGGLSEALEYPIALEFIAWYVRLNRDYSRHIMIDSSSSVQDCCQVLWEARDDVPVMYHLLRETPNLTAIMEFCLMDWA